MTQVRPASAQEQTAHGRRADIELLRVLAVGAVMLFHFAPGWTLSPNGYLGVDVFFTISGFVITQQMLKSHARGDLTYASFLGRRVRRLLPSAVLVIAVTFGVMLLIAPAVLVKEQAAPAIAALLYVSNFYFAQQSFDYFGGEADASPFLHFWSLGVEEQFYVVWPFVFMAALALAARRRLDPRAVLGAIIVIGAVASFVGAAFAVADNASVAFFMPWWRAYQLLIGAGVALWVHHARRPVSLRAGRLDLVALARLLSLLALVVLVTQPWLYIPSPGPLSLLVAVPVAVVLATPRPATDALVRWGSRAVPAWIATCSYVLYLWHWPVWVLLWQWRPIPDPLLVVAALTVSAVLSWITHRAVEVPFRDGSWVRRLPARRVVAIGLAASVATAGAVGVSAAAVQVPAWQASLRPQLEDLRTDGSPDTDACFAPLAATEVLACERGDTASDRTVMLVGDSHAMMWHPAFVAAADKDGFRLITATKQSCQPWDIPLYSVKAGRAYTECEQWRSALLDYVAAEKPDLVVMTGAHTARYIDESGDDVDPSSPEVAAAVDRTLRAFDAVAPTVLLEDIVLAPRPPDRCLAEAEQADDCDFVGRPDAPGRVSVRAGGEAAGVPIVDPYEHMCVDGLCRVVTEDGIVVYRDSAHLTNTYATSVGPWVSEWVARLLAD